MVRILLEADETYVDDQNLNDKLAEWDQCGGLIVSRVEPGSSRSA